MEPIPVFRAAHLIPYLGLLHGIGTPVERVLRQAKLPTTPAEQPEAHLPLLRTLQFLTEMARSEGVDDLALRAREHVKISDLSPSFVGAICCAPTLHAALEAFCRLAPLEDAQLDVWMVSGASETRICCRERIPFDMHATRHCETNTNMLLVAIVRAFAGREWGPTNMAFRSSLPLGRYASEQLPNTRFLIGQRTAWIDLPRTMLSLPPQAMGCTRGLQTPAHGGHAASVEPPAVDFPGSLKRVLPAYLGDGYPDIRLAAEIAGTSVRTLQRRLAEAGLSYSALIEQARFEAAAQMLKDPDRKVIDVTYALGYENPSNFARAFRRIAGVSPREFRRQQAGGSERKSTRPVQHLH